MGSACTRSCFTPCCTRESCKEEVEKARSGDDDEANGSMAACQSLRVSSILSQRATKSPLLVGEASEDQMLDEFVDEDAKLGGNVYLTGPEDLQRRYILYPETCDGAERVWSERQRFLRKRPGLAARIAANLTLARTGKARPLANETADDRGLIKFPAGELRVTKAMLDNLKAARRDVSGPLGTIGVCQILSEVARLAWHARAAVTDGFVAVPRGVFSARVPGSQEEHEYGCFVYYSPRTRDFEVDCLPRMLAHFLFNGGRPGNFMYCGPANEDGSTKEAAYFPSEVNGEFYTHGDNAAFRENADGFLPKLINKDCNQIGIHMDMVLSDSVDTDNFVCVALIFGSPRR